MSVRRFLQVFISPQLFNAPVRWRPNAVVVGELFRFLRFISRGSAGPMEHRDRRNI